MSVFVDPDRNLLQSNEIQMEMNTLSEYADAQAAKRPVESNPLELHHPVRALFCVSLISSSY